MTRVIPRSPEDLLAASTTRKVTRRVVPLLVLGYLVSYIDRINIGFAKFGMERTFEMSGAQYGFAAGIFFLGYILAEVPSNIIMARVGARIWLCRILVTWGIIAAFTAVAPNVEVLYAMRFLLGVAEAGFFPGIILYLAHWYPNRQRAKVIATVMMSIPLASALGSPLNGWILSAFDGVFGWEGWRWVFIVGGVPAVILGVVFFFAVTDKPSQARWLTEAEREWLTTTLATEEKERAAAAPAGHRAVLRNKKVIWLSVAYFLVLCGAYPLTYWMPSVIKDIGKGLSTVQVGWLSAVPFIMAAVCMYLVGRRVRDERSAKPVLVALVLSLITFVITSVSLGTPMLAFAAITVATMAAQTAKPLFWSLPTAYLAGVGAASGIALINSLGNAAGFVSPFAVGWIQDATGGNAGLSIGVMISANALALIVIGWFARRRRVTAGP
ncbi:MFS transporter [Actinocrispum wychmicini]|uniref:Sugar phosphate permease n=1 Tax=Actinocrispum wychmicini TaxID=1213861 RepID=A0A4R2IK60_9PSEU|nr:MFS transporter [Actinocrispum wychmicini]TCO44812.1 sugar phosphate permease [Actinocrispum wychmicini]